MANELRVSAGSNKLYTDANTSPTQSTYTQTYSTTTTTVPNATAVNPVTTGATSTTPYGFVTAAQADAITLAVAANGADILAVKKVVGQIIDDLQAAGLAL